MSYTSTRRPFSSSADGETRHKEKWEKPKNSRSAGTARPAKRKLRKTQKFPDRGRSARGVERRAGFGLVEQAGARRVELSGQIHIRHRIEISGFDEPSPTEGIGGAGEGGHS